MKAMTERRAVRETELRASDLSEDALDPVLHEIADLPPLVPGILEDLEEEILVGSDCFARQAVRRALEARGRPSNAKSLRKFSTYGVWWIERSLVRCLANDPRVVRVPNPVLGRRGSVSAETSTETPVGFTDSVILEALAELRDTEVAQSIPGLGCLNGSTRALVGEAGVAAEAL